MSAGLCTVDIPGLDPLALQKAMRARDGILVQAFTDEPSEGERRAGVRGLRVSPNVYTTLAELDRFVAAVVSAARAERR